MKFAHLLLASFFLPSALALGEANWAHEKSDLAVDPAVTWGKLPNGLRYAILPNPEPPDRISLRIHVDAGSLMESEEQRGLAHFLEHMAFNGTKNFPAGEMVEYFQRLGMSFGGDTNAFTSFDQTAYQLELPSTDEALLRKSLLLLRDYAQRMNLSQEEIDKERGVILSEKTTRDSVDYRTWKESIKFALPEGLIANRSPIGLEKVIKGANRDRFVDFYTRYYTPSRITIVATGAVDPKTLSPLIREYFADFKRDVEPGADPDLGKVTTGRGIVAKLHTENEASATEVNIDTLKPITAQPDSGKNRRKKLVRNMANMMVNNRLDELSKSAQAPFTSAQAYGAEFLEFVDFSGIKLTCQPDEWKGALAVGEQEIRRAIEHGFTDVELDEVRANLEDMYEESAKSAATRKSRGLADQLVSTINGNRVFMHPSASYDWAKSTLEKISAEDCQKALADSWESKDRLIFISGNLTIPEAEKTILTTYRESAKMEVTPPENEETSAWAYEDFGTPGKVIGRKVVEDLDITQIQFENNVRLNLKTTDFEKDTVRISVRIGNGKLTAPLSQPGLSAFASSVLNLGGLEAHSNDELERILAGKTVGSTFSVGDDGFGISGTTNREDLLLELQLLAASITSPGYREEAVTQFVKGIDPLYKQLESDPMGVYQSEIDALLKGNDPRFSFPDRHELEARTLEEVKQWLTEPLNNGFMEIGIVGDFDKEEAIKAVARTFGALSPRADAQSVDPALRRLDYPHALREAHFDFESKIPKGLALVLWPTTDMDDISTTRRLSILSAIFADRLRIKIREELGEAYSPYARNSSSSVFADYGYLFALVTISPGQEESVIAAIKGAADALHADGTNADELERAIKPVLTQVEQQRRSNAYWLGTVVARSQSGPRYLEWARSMIDDFKTITVEEINALARGYFDPANALKIVVKPAATEAE